LIHSAQEPLSSECTPTLSLILPAYKIIHQILHAYLRKNEYPHLQHAIRAALEKIDGYVELAGQNAVYGISMFVNPTIKMMWMTNHWSAAQANASLHDVKDAMFAYATAKSEDTQKADVSPRPTPTAAAPTTDAHERASNNLGARFKGLQDIFESSNRMVSGEDNGASDTVGHAENLLSNTQDAQDALDRQRVDAKVLRYMVDLNVTNATTSFDILLWWQMHQFSYPYCGRWHMTYCLCRHHRSRVMD
jgi:hypothetical protein